MLSEDPAVWQGELHGLDPEPSLALVEGDGCEQLGIDILDGIPPELLGFRHGNIDERATSP